MEIYTNDLKEKVVSCHLKCQTKNFKYLSILDLEQKVTNDEDYDIGGTYSDGPDYWFMCRVRKFVKNQVLLSLFVCNRRAGSFTLTVGDYWQKMRSYDGSDVTQDVCVSFGENPACYNFYSLPADTYSFVTTMQIGEEKLKYLSNADFYIEIQIESDVIFSKDVKESVKLNHDFGKLRNDKETFDLTLISADSSTLMAHKAIVANHSSVIKKLLEASTSHLELPETSSNLDLLLQFMYTGTIEEDKRQDYLRLLDLGIKYDVVGLIQLSENNLRNDINIDNAIHILELAQVHRLDMLRKQVCIFIKENPDVYESQPWKDLKDVELTKALLKCISSMK